jgi:hypothetical protein
MGHNQFQYVTCDVAATHRMYVCDLLILVLIIIFNYGRKKVIANNRIYHTVLRDFMSVCRVMYRYRFDFLC